ARRRRRTPTDPSCSLSMGNVSPFLRPKCPGWLQAMMTPRGRRYGDRHDSDGRPMDEQPVTPPGSATNRALARGLYVLRRLVESGPMSATELARELGLHQSSISRVMATLGEAGFVRKDEHGRFVPDYGVITLAAETTRLPLLTKPVPEFRALLEEDPP